MEADVIKIIVYTESYNWPKIRKTKWSTLGGCKARKARNIFIYKTTHLSDLIVLNHNKQKRVWFYIV